MCAASLCVYICLTYLQILALTLNIVLAHNLLAVEHHIGKASNPITKEYATRLLAKRQILIYMSVPEYKAIHRWVFF